MQTRTLSVFFNADRIYLSVVRIDNNRAYLDYIESTNHRFDLENTDSPESVNALNELEVFISDFDFKPDRLSIALPSESIFVTKFPARINFTKEQLRQLVNLEIRQAYPEFNYEDFMIKATPILSEKTKKEQMLGMIYMKSDLKFIENFFNKFDLKIDNIEISQLAAHNAFILNYPEMKGKCVMIIGYHGQFLDFTVIRDGELLYYNIASVSSPDKVGEAAENEHIKIIETATDEIDACYFYGSALNKNVSLALWETSMMLGIMEAKRLNPFRMMTTELDKRHLEYCLRTFQIYPPCTGSSLKSWHKIITIE